MRKMKKYASKRKRIPKYDWKIKQVEIGMQKYSTRNYKFGFVVAWNK